MENKIAWVIEPHYGWREMIDERLHGVVIGNDDAKMQFNVRAFASFDQALEASAKLPPEELPDVITTNLLGKDAARGGNVLTPVMENIALIEQRKGKAIGTVVVSADLETERRFDSFGYKTARYISKTEFERDPFFAAVNEVLAAAKAEAPRITIDAESAEGKGGLPGQKHHGAFIV